MTVLGAPGSDLLVIAAEEHLGDHVTAEFAWACVLRKFQQVRIGKGVLYRAAFVAEHSRN